MTKADRGRLDKVNDSLNKPKTFCGIDYRLLAICFSVAVVVFLCGLKIVSCAVLGGSLLFGYAITSKDEKILDIWWLRLEIWPFKRGQGAYYDPGKRDKK